MKRLKTRGKLLLSLFCAVIIYILLALLCVGGGYWPGSILYMALIAILSGVAVFTIQCVFSRRAARCVQRILEEQGEALRYHCECIYCEQKPIVSGVVYLTDTELCFQSTEKSRPRSISIPVESVTELAFGLVCHVLGMTVSRRGEPDICIALSKEHFERFREMILPEEG